MYKKRICFSNQREISTWSSGYNILWIRWISFRASCNTRHEKISQQTMLSPIYLKTLFILAFLVLWTFSITHRFIEGMSFARKMYWNLLSVFVNVILLWTDLKTLNPKHPSFVCRLCLWSSAFPQRASSSHGASASAPSYRRKPTAARRAHGQKAAWGETPLHLAALNGHVAAAELLLAKGAAVDAKTNGCPGPQKQKSSLSNLGCLKSPCGMEIRLQHCLQNIDGRATKLGEIIKTNEITWETKQWETWKMKTWDEKKRTPKTSKTQYSFFVFFFLTVYYTFFQKAKHTLTYSLFHL